MRGRLAGRSSGDGRDAVQPVDGADGTQRLGGEAFVLALRIALPVIGLLFLVDLVMGVVGRVNAQMQIIGLSFPLKMLAALLLLCSLLTVFPKLYMQQSMRTIGVIQEHVRPAH